MRASPFSQADQSQLKITAGTLSSHKRLGRRIGFIVLALAFIAIVARLFQLTVVRGHYYRDLADSNRLRREIVPADRGRLLDRKGSELRGVAFSHVIGYLGEASVDEIKRDLCDVRLRSRMQTGKSGAQKIFDCVLRGVPGVKLNEVSADERYIKTASYEKPVNGADVILAIDHELQEYSYEALEGKKGAVIVMKPQNGEILALVSSPGYDTASIAEYLKDPDKPLFNRATEGIYPPGSVFKMVLAAGALEDDKIDEETVVDDRGEIEVGGIKFGNWYYIEHGKKEGLVNLVKSLRRSNDTFYYRIGALLGPERIGYWAKKFGYGQVFDTGFSEKEGLIPSPFWKEDQLKDEWYLGDTYNLSIGQGYVQTTPLQVAVMTQTLANNGYRCTPRIQKVQKGEHVQCENIEVSRNTLDLVHDGMVAACKMGGTGWPFFDFSPSVACKTGTAENTGGSREPHAWFTAYAPEDSPEIVVTVLVEEGGQGSDVAAPIARKILEKYFARTQ